jgi:hypothetical protein
MPKKKDIMGSLTSLKLQVDHNGRIHTLTNNTATWKFMTPIKAIDFVETYNGLLAETSEGLTSLKIQVDCDGRVYSFSAAN